ncbi:MAG TPA: glycosyltransferase [Candidatus Eremiobacteraceae bacterium]|nr:glycosyltransferase [Candidatus Eremiobacteraceae bacterium]
MSRADSVSVVVPVYNGAATIADMLSGLLAQSGIADRDVEFIVVDNNSTDSTPDIVRSFPVTFLQERKPGAGAARNCGLRHARGSIIAYLDADTLPTRRWLMHLANVFDDSDVVIAVGNTLVFQPQTAEERYCAAAGLNYSERAIERRPFPFAPSLNMAVRREAAMSIGGWAEDMPTAEDVDFSLRLLRAYPATITYARDAVLFHKNRSDRSSLLRQAWTYGQGAADMYLRYPEVARWDFRKSCVLAAILGMRGLAPPLLRAARLLRMATPEQVEFATYHRFWTFWYWRGFFSMLQHRTRLAP